MKKILTSECLYGGRTVRYDAGDCTETILYISNGKRKAV